MKSDQKFTINWQSVKIHSFLDYCHYENKHCQVQIVDIRDRKAFIQGISDQSFRLNVDLEHNPKIKPFRTFTKPSENLRFVFHRRYCYWGDGFYWSLQQLKKLNESSDLTGGNTAWDIIQFLRGINFYMIHSFLDKKRITQNNFQLNFQYIKEFLNFFSAYLKNVNITLIDFKRMYESPKLALIHSYPQLFINFNQLLIEPVITFNSFNKIQDQQTIVSKTKMAQISLYCKKWLVDTFIPFFLGNQQILKNLNEDAVQRLLKTLLKLRQKKQPTAANGQPALSYSSFSSIIIPLANHLGSLYCSNPIRKANEGATMLEIVKQFIQLSDKTNRQQFLSVIRCKLRLVILLNKRPKEDVLSLLVSDKLRFFTSQIHFVLSCSDYQELRELVLQFLVGTIGNQGIEHYIKGNMHNSTEISKMYRLAPNQLTTVLIRLHKLDCLKNNIRQWDYQHLFNILNLWKIQIQKLQQIKDKDKQRQKIRHTEEFLMSCFVSKFIQPIFHNLQQVFKEQKTIYQNNLKQCQKLLNIQHINRLQHRQLFLKFYSQFQQKLIKFAERVYDGYKTSSIQYIDNFICKKMIKNNPQLIIGYISKRQFTTFSETYFLLPFFKQYELSRANITTKNIYSMCFSKLCETMIEMKTKELLQIRRGLLIMMLRRLSANLPEQLISHLCLYLVSVSKVQSLEFKSKTYQFLTSLLTHHSFKSQQQKLFQYKQCLDSMTVQTQVQYRTFIWLFKQINQRLLGSPLIKFIKNEQMVFVPVIIFGRPYGLQKIYDILDRQIQRSLVKKCTSFFYKLHKKVVDEQLRDQLMNEICQKIMNYLERNWHYCCIGYGNLERKKNRIQQQNYNDFIALLQDYTVRYSSQKEIFQYYTNLNTSYLKLLGQQQAKIITTERQKMKIIVNLPSTFNVEYSGMDINDEGFDDVLGIENREEENMTEQNGKKNKNFQLLMDGHADNIIAKIKQKAADLFQISPICSNLYLTDVTEAGNGKTVRNINKKVSLNDEMNSIQSIVLNYRMEICSNNDQKNMSSLEQVNNFQQEENQNNQLSTIVFTLKPFEKRNIVQQILRDKLEILFIWLPNTKLIWDYLSITSYDWQINSKLANLKNFLISYPTLLEQFQGQNPETLKALLNAVMGQPIRKKIFLQAVLENTNHENKVISWLYSAFGEICNAADVQNNQLVLQILMKTEQIKEINQDLRDLRKFECFQQLMYSAIAQDSNIKDFEDSYFLFVQKLFQYLKNRYRNNLFDYLKIMKPSFYANSQNSSKFFKLFIEALTKSFIQNLVSSSKFLNNIGIMLNHCSYPLKIVSQSLLKNPSLIPNHPCCNQWLKSNLAMIENPQFRNQYKTNPLPCRIILNFITALIKSGCWTNFKNLSKIIMEETFSKLGKEIVMIMTAICSKPEEQESITEQGKVKEQVNSKFIRRSELATNFIQFFMRQTEIPDWSKSSSIKFTRNYNGNDIVYVGLKNPHSICYVNTFLQQLYHIQEFREQLYRTNWKKNDVIEQDLIYQLKKIFVNLNFRQCESYINHGFFEAFKNIQGEPTSLEVQMDVDEFRSILLDRLENLIIKPENQSLNFIQKLFSVKQVTIIKSTQCQHSSSKDQNQYSLCLQVKGFKKLSESLENYFKPEVLKGDNSYLCEDCNRKVTAEKTFIIKQYPKYLTFVLKRFEYVNYFKKKINQRLQFPINQMNIQGNEYFLKGVIVHQGISQAGHYISLIKINGRWFQFNDNLVSQINEQEVKLLSYGENSSRINRNAYLLIYQKETIEEIKMEEQSTVQLPYKLKFQEQISSIRKFNTLNWKTEIFFSEEFQIFIETIVKNRIEGSINLLYKYITTIKAKSSRFNLKSIQNLFNLLENYSTSSLLNSQQHVFNACHFYRKNHLNSSIIVQFTSILIKRYQKFDIHIQFFLIQCLCMINEEIQTSPIYQLFLALCKKDQKILKYLIDARIIGRIYKACWPSILLTADIQQLAKSTQINFPTGNEPSTQTKKKFQQSYLRYHKWQLIRYIIQSGYPLHKTEQSFVSNWVYRKPQLIFEQATTKSTINEISKFFCFLSVKYKYFGDCYLKEICQQITKDKPEYLLRYLKSALDLVRINDSYKLIRMREIFASFKQTFKNLQRNKMPLIFDIKLQWFLKIFSCPQFRPILQQNIEQLKFMTNHHQMQLLIFSRNQQSSNNDLKNKNRFYGLKFAVYQQPGYSSQIFQQKVEKARRLLLGQAAQPSRDTEQMQNDDNSNDQMMDESWLQKDLLDYPEVELKQGTKILRFSEKTMVFEQVEITGIIGNLIQIGDQQTYDRGDERLTLPFEYQKIKREDDLKKQFDIQSQQ